MAILVIEDDDDIREAVQQLLQAEGYQTRGAANGELARQILVGSARAPRLIVLDLNMPVMDGWDFLLWLDDNKQLREIPVAIMSAHPSLQHALEIAATRRGAPHWQPHGGPRLLLPKPLDVSRLLSAAAEMCSPPRGATRT